MNDTTRNEQEHHRARRKYGGDRLWWQMMFVLSMALLFSGPAIGWGLSIFFLVLAVLVRVFDQVEDAPRLVFGIQVALSLLVLVWALEPLVFGFGNSDGSWLVVMLASTACYVCTSRLLGAIRVHRHNGQMLRPH